MNMETALKNDHITLPRADETPDGFADRPAAAAPAGFVDPRAAELERGQKIVRVSLVGILVNLLLAGGKALLGLMSHSIAMVLDAVNNLSDVLSSVVTILGTKLAAKAPDKEHPMGHGRIEYLSSLIIAVIILYAGVTALVASVRKILDPAAPEYGTAAILMMVIAVPVKILLGRYIRRRGDSLHSEALVNSGEDAMLDAVITGATLIAAIIYLACQVSLEAWLAGAISLYIIKSGIDMLRSSISQILGRRVDAQLAREIRETIEHFPEVHGCYDLALHSYGPQTLAGSAHIEVPDTWTAVQIDAVTREIQREVYLKYQVVLTAIGVYARNTQDSEAAAIQEDIRALVSATRYVLQMHGFYLNAGTKELHFDIVVSFDAPDREEVHQQLQRTVQWKYPEYRVHITLDSDLSD